MKKKSVEKCLRCHGPLSNYNTRKFCNACQGNLEARFPVYVTFQEDDDITLDWWTSPEEFKRMIKDGKKRIVVMVDVRTFSDLLETHDLLQKRDEETEGVFTGPGIMSVVVPRIVQEAFKRL